MAIGHYVCIIVTVCIFKSIVVNANSHNGSSSSNPILDVKRRNDLVEETFMEQKDILLEMLETKLKEVRDKKKKKSDKVETSNNCHLEPNRCELPKNVDMRLKGNGISAIGEADLQLRYGKSGKGTLNLDASGISNVGKAQLDLGVGDGAVHIPGLENLFVGQGIANNDESDITTNNDKIGNIAFVKMETRRNNTEEQLIDVPIVTAQNGSTDAHVSTPKETEVKINATVIEITTTAVTKSNDIFVPNNVTHRNLTNTNVIAK